MNLGIFISAVLSSGIDYYINNGRLEVQILTPLIAFIGIASCNYLKKERLSESADEE